jgi:3-hydroxybutyryl-CoA dehydrogenase
MSEQAQELESIAVIGAGTMGSGIAQCCAMAGLEVRLVDTTDAFLSRGMESVKASLARFVKSQKLDQGRADAVFARIRPGMDLASAVAGAHVVIEVVPEVMELKQKVFRQVAELAAPASILATNTSQLSITAIAAAVDRPQDVIGMHFFNPPVLMRLVEVVRGLRTSDRALAVALALTARLGKEAAVCKRDTVGFITTRAAAALRLECVRMYEEGVASMEDIDRAMRLGFNHPMGPFELTDFNGLDVALYNTLSLKEAYGERFNPPQSMVARVKAGQLGRKTGSGWYDYSGDAGKPSKPSK